MQRKVEKKSFFFLRCKYLNWLHEIVSIKKRILVIDSQCVNKSLKILHSNKRDFLQHIYHHNDQ